MRGDPTIVTSATCTYCGCLCDDIDLHTDRGRIVRADRACALGKAWFFGHRNDTQHGALVDGRPATMPEAIEKAADILTRAHLPLIYGLGNSTNESQREAILLAEDVGGVVDSHTSLTHGPSKVGAQLVGKVTCTLGEVKNRADLLIYWGTDPVDTHPRHFTKYAFTPAGRFVPEGRHGRTMVLVDVRETLSARAADCFLQIRPDTDFEMLTVLRAILRDQAVDPALLAITGLTPEHATGLVDESWRVHGRGHARPARSRCGVDCRRRSLVNHAAGGHRSPGADPARRDRSAGPRPSSKARVHFTTASPGITASGTAYRMDKVPISIRAAVGTPQPTDEDVLGGIRQALAAA